MSAAMMDRNGYGGPEVIDRNGYGGPEMMDRNGYGGPEMNPPSTSSYIDDHHRHHHDTPHHRHHGSSDSWRFQDQHHHMRQPSVNTPSTHYGSRMGGYSNGSQSISSQSSPRRPVYYRLASPEHGLPLGRYEQQRKILGDIRHWEYNKLLQEKLEKEREEAEARHKQSMVQSMMAATHRSNQEENLYDYEEIKEKLRKERQQEYNEFRKQQDVASRFRSPPTPPGGGLPVGGYEEKKKKMKENAIAAYKASLDSQKKEKLMIQLKNLSQNPVPNMATPYPEVYFHDPEEVKQNLREERQQEYNCYKTQKENQPIRRPVTPPFGLNIPTQIEREREANERKKVYAEDLRKQQDVQRMNRAQHHLGIQVIDRSGQQNGYHGRTLIPLEQQNPHHVYKDPVEYRPRDHDYQGPHLPREDPRSPGQRQSPRRSPQAYSPSKSREAYSPSKSRDPPYTGSRSNQPHSHDSNHAHHHGHHHSKRDRSDHQTPSYWDNGMPVKSPPLSVSSRGSRASTQQSGRSVLTPKHNENPPPYLNLEAYRDDPMKVHRKMERQKGYEELKAKIAREDARKAMEIDKKRKQPATQPRFGDFDSAEMHDKFKRRLEDNKKREYQSYVDQSRSDSRRPRSHEEFMISQTNSRTENREEYSHSTRRRGSTGHLDMQQHKMNQKGRRYSGDYTSSHSYGNFDNPHSQSADGDNFAQKPSQRRTPNNYGLPLSQKPYDEMKAKQEKQRNKEYNELLLKKGVPYDKDVIRFVNKYHSGRAQKTIKRYLLNKVQGEHPFIQHVDPVSKLIVPWENGLPIGQHRYKDWHHLLENQRNTEYKSLLQETPGTPDDFRPQGKKEGVNVDLQGAFPTGEYETKRSQFKQDWKRSYQEYADKQRLQVSKNHFRVQSEMSVRDREHMDTPPILPRGEYQERRKKFNENMRATYKSYVKTLPNVIRNKSFWEAEDKPRIIPSSGENRQRKERFQNERIQEFREHMQKVEPPKERKKTIGGEQGAVLFEGKYDKVKQKMNAERKKEMMDFYEKKQSEMPRRHEDPSNDKRSMFTDMEAREPEQAKNEMKKQDYKTSLEEVAYPNGPPNGLPTFVGGRSIPNSWYPSDTGPMMRPPHSRDRAGQSNAQPSYEAILEQKRKEETSYRRFDDPEYNRPGDQSEPVTQQRY